MTISKEAIKNVYQQLKDRKIDPSGSFDNGGRWYAEHKDLINVRTPSRRWPYSELTACRTLKYVKAVAEKFGCDTEEELLKRV